MRIVLGSDHAGFRVKGMLAEYLEGKGHQVTDVGTHTPDMVDYPAFCAAAARAVVAGDADLGIVIGGSGQGEQIAANKVHGIRAALCFNEFTARLARQHNNANVLSIGARVLGDELILSIVDTFLAQGFDGGRHQRRIDQVAAIEREECADPA